MTLLYDMFQKAMNEEQVEQDVLAGLERVQVAQSNAKSKQQSLHLMKEAKERIQSIRDHVRQRLTKFPGATFDTCHALLMQEKVCFFF